MSHTLSPCSIAAIQHRIAPLRATLTAHPLYAALRTAGHVRVFMESHVFAVWDFMWLLKSLQLRLTSVAVPWVPSPFPASRRFLNEIVLGEESDEYNGTAVSHFELYVQAMRRAGASTAAIDTAVAQALQGRVDLSAAPSHARAFVGATYALIQHGSTAAQAAAFTFGREDVIPDMFRELVRELSAASHGQWDTFLWYLERHIEVDGEDHGPLSLRMVQDLCGNSPQRWEEAATAAEAALSERIALWNGILATLQATP